jgi:hypothetical protein
MRTIKIAVLVLAMAVALFMIFPNLSWVTLSGAVVSQRVNR